MSIQEFRPKSLLDYLQVIERLRSQGSETLWYRGCSTKAHRLLPSLYRKRANPGARPSDLSVLEAQLYARFRDRSLAYRQHDFTGALEQLFFMQHFGVPTRLLDWTENPFTGLFFAVRNAEQSSGGTGSLRFVREAVVWILDPSDWNQHALRHQSYPGGPLDPGAPQVAPYSEIGAISRLPNNPIAVFGAHNSQRIVVQQGTFVIYGGAARPMDALHRIGRFPGTALRRLILTPGAIKSIRDTLFKHGVTEGALFPDLEGLGRDLRRVFGFDL